MTRTPEAKVEVLVRPGCGSCMRVTGEVRAVCAPLGVAVAVVDLEAAGAGGAVDVDLRAEYADRVPVVLVDGEEFACWEVDADELRAELAGGVSR